MTCFALLLLVLLSSTPAVAFQTAGTHTAIRTTRQSWNIVESPMIAKTNQATSSMFRSRQWLYMATSAAYTDDEWHPHDPAWTVPQLLGGIWHQIAQAKDMVRGVRGWRCGCRRGFQFSFIESYIFLTVCAF
jgi:hypothetical protein